MHGFVDWTKRGEDDKEKRKTLAENLKFPILFQFHLALQTSPLNSQLDEGVAIIWFWLCIHIFEFQSLFHLPSVSSPWKVFHGFYELFFLIFRYFFLAERGIFPITWQLNSIFSIFPAASTPSSSQTADKTQGTLKYRRAHIVWSSRNHFEIAFPFPNSKRKFVNSQFDARN